MAGQVRCGVDVIAFEEHDLLADVPACVDPVAGMLMCGHWLKEAPNFEDVIIGCTRLPQFKDARAMNLKREVRFYFINRMCAVSLAGGDKLTPGQWLTRWNDDPTFQRLVRASPKWREWRDGLAIKLRGTAKCVLAVEDTRQAHAVLRGKKGNQVIAAAMNNYMEKGGI